MTVPNFTGYESDPVENSSGLRHGHSDQRLIVDCDQDIASANAVVDRVRRGVVDETLQDAFPRQRGDDAPARGHVQVYA